MKCLPRVCLWPRANPLNFGMILTTLAIQRLDYDHSFRRRFAVPDWLTVQLEMKWVLKHQNLLMFGLLEVTGRGNEIQLLVGEQLYYLSQRFNDC